MKRIINTVFWICLAIISVVLIYNSIISQTKLFKRYKFGTNYNDFRVQHDVPILPETFVEQNEPIDEPLLVWVNPHIMLNYSSYTHIKKVLTIRNSELLLEEDYFQLKSNDKVNLINTLLVKHYYDSQKNNKKEVIISGEILNDKQKFLDTITNQNEF